MLGLIFIKQQKQICFTQALIVWKYVHNIEVMCYKPCVAASLGKMVKFNSLYAHSSYR